MAESIKAFIRGHACRRGLVVDIGCGSGGSTRLVAEACGPAYTVGVDLDAERLAAAKQNPELWPADLVCSDASMLPIRSSTATLVVMAFLLHEAAAEAVDAIIREAWRVLRRDGILFFADKILFKPQSPSEELVLLTEEALHRLLEYLEGTRVWGLRRPEEYMSRLTAHGFKPLATSLIQGRHVAAKDFLSSWGNKTLKLMDRLDDDKRRELARLVEKIKSIGGKYGYGPSRIMVMTLGKTAQPRTMDEGREG